MTLNIGASGTIKPYAKYNSKADKWFAKGDGGDVEVARPTFVADFPNIATGWLRFREGQAPERVMDPSLDKAAPAQDEGFKRGFVVAVFSQKFFGGIAELSSASIHMCNAVREVYQTYTEQKDAHRGQLPVIVCTGSEAMKDKYGTNYKPKFEIAKWVDRPAELPDESPVDPKDVFKGEATSSPRPQQGTPVSPPAAKPATDPLMETEF